jgi:hypothetical protein
MIEDISYCWYWSDDFCVDRKNRKNNPMNIIINGTNAQNPRYLSGLLVSVVKNCVVGYIYTCNI